MIDWKNSELWAWLKADKYSITLTILCAILPLVLQPLFFNNEVQDDKKYGEKTQDEQRYYEMERMNSAMQGAFVLVAIGIIMFSYQPSTLQDVSDKAALQQYIEDECGLQQTENNTSETAYKVVKGTVRQFYHFWIAIWWIWMIYYVGDYLYLFTGDNIYKLPEVQQNMSVIKRFLDFCSSVAMFGVYFVLNNTTVNISSRSRHPYRNIYFGISAVAMFLLIFVVLQALYLANTSNPELIKYNYYTDIFLGSFSALSLVFVLGKFNSNYLNVPRLLMYILYVYAISQTFTVFNHVPDVGWPKEFAEMTWKLSMALPWISFIGKIALLITLSWILYERRFIFYIIHRSLLNTEAQIKLKEFKRYMV